MLNENQLFEHYNSIGGTLAASILGVNPYQSNVDAYLTLTDEHYRLEKQNEISKKIQVKIGNLLEDVVASIVKEEKGWELIAENNTLKHQKHAFLTAHPDRIIIKPDGNEILEIKTRGNQSAKNYGEEGTDEILESEAIQIMHYLMVTGYKRAHLAVLFLGTGKIKYFVVDRDEELIEEMLKLLTDFWENNVLKKIPPKPASYDDAVKIFSKSFEGSVVYATPEIYKIASEIKNLKKNIVDLEKEVDAKKADLATFMGVNDQLLDENGHSLVTFKNQKTNRIDTEKLKREYQEVAKDCYKESVSRVMRFSNHLN